MSQRVPHHWIYEVEIIHWLTQIGLQITVAEYIEKREAFRSACKTMAQLEDIPWEDNPQAGEEYERASKIFNEYIDWIYNLPITVR
jgi:hypothetical protein